MIGMSVFQLEIQSVFRTQIIINVINPNISENVNASYAYDSRITLYSDKILLKNNLDIFKTIRANNIKPRCRISVP